MLLRKHLYMQLEGKQDSQVLARGAPTLWASAADHTELGDWEIQVELSQDQGDNHWLPNPNIQKPSGNPVQSSIWEMSLAENDLCWALPVCNWNSW